MLTNPGQIRVCTFDRTKKCTFERIPTLELKRLACGGGEAKLDRSANKKIIAERRTIRTAILIRVMKQHIQMAVVPEARNVTGFLGQNDGGPVVTLTLALRLAYLPGLTFTFTS